MNTKSVRVVIIGGIYLDHLARGEDLPRGGMTLSAREYRSAQGAKAPIRPWQWHAWASGWRS